VAAKFSAANSGAALPDDTVWICASCVAPVTAIAAVTIDAEEPGGQEEGGGEDAW